MNAQPPLLELRKLGRQFVQGGLMGKQKVFQAVDDVSLTLAQQKTLGLVGESGSGKSTLAKMAVGLLSPSQGNVFFSGQPIYDTQGQKADRAFIRTLPSRVQMIFQDPYSSLNPRLKVGYSIAEALICRGDGQKESRGKVAALLDKVGLNPKDAHRYPHEFSGGQRQRIAVARAMASEPELIVCDEPVSSLDASVQAQILNLLKDSQDEMRLSYLFISHDLSVVSHMSDQVAVMYMGRIVELGETDQIFSAPQHPYTMLLLEAASGKKKGRHSASTVKASSDIAQNGCAFAPRCPKAKLECTASIPALECKMGHQVSCFYPG